MNENPQNRLKSSQKLKVLFFLILSFLFCQSLISQSITWQRTYQQYAYNYGFGACQTTDGNFVIVGQAVGSKLFAMKINPLGDTLWSIIQNDMPISLGLSVTPSDNGSVILTGGWNKAFVIKLNSNGIIEWNRTYANGTIDCNEIKKTNDGGFIFCGGFVYDTERAYVCKIDSLGNMLWQKVYSSNFHKAFRSIELAHDGGYIMTGEVQESSVTPGKILIFKINESGDSLWEKRFSFTNTSPGGIKIRKINNAYIIGGLTNDTNYRQQIFFANIKLNGDTNFVKTYPTYGRNEFFDDIAVINSNKYVICYDRDSSTVNYSSISMITDSLGNILHKRIFTNTSYFIWGRLSTIVPISNGDILFTGTAKVTQPFGSEVVHAIRTDSLLNSPVIGISNENENTPSDFNLIQNFPNPFNPNTNILYEIKTQSNIKIEIYNVLGVKIETLLEGKIKPGKYALTWNAQYLSSGVYFIRLLAENNIIKTIKATLIK